MIKSIQFSEGVLSLAITGSRAASATKRQCSVKFDFGEGGAIAELHRREFMDFLYAIDAEGAYEIGNVVFELLGTQAGVRGVYLDLFYSASESLEGSAAPDVQVELASGAVERAGGEEDIPF
jgi:hypothetical protein